MIAMHKFLDDLVFATILLALYHFTSMLHMMNLK